MTVSSQQNRAAFPGDGISSQFDFAIPGQGAEDFTLLRRNLTTGETRPLANLSEYALALTSNGGRATLAGPLPTGFRLVIVRTPAPLQETDLVENDTYSAETLEKALDRQAMISQRLFDLVSRSLVLDDADLQGSGSFGAKSNRITALADGVDLSDAVTLGQVTSLIGSGGGSGGGGGGSGSSGWPTIPIPPAVQAIINQGLLTSSEFQAVFTPINASLGNLSSSILSQGSQLSSFNTSIGTINTSIASMQAAIDLLAQLQGDGTAIVTLINTEKQQRIDGDTATATLINKIGAASGDNVSFILNLNTAKVSPTESLSQRFGSITTTLGQNTAAINSETTARTTADTAITQTLSKIGASSGDGVSFILNLDSVRVLPTETLGQRLSQIATAVNGATAAIAAETTARSTADSSIAAQIGTLQTTVGGYTASISAVTSSVNGINARYTVKIDNNGRIAGIGLISEPNNGTIVSSFVVNADAFKVYNGTTDVLPFSVVGGVVRMQNVEIQDASIVNLSVTKLTTGSLNADMNIGTGRIILDNGSTMKVMSSAGFGTTNQFSEWRGPHLASISLCSEANAFSYEKLDGSSYFGGSLSAGTLFNAQRSTDLANNAQVTVGPFGTNGNTKTVVFSYGYSSNFTGGTSSGPSQQTGAISATINCYRKIGAAAETQIATLNVTGTYEIDREPGLTSMSQGMGGSTTFTDNVAGTSDRTFRAAIVARTLGFAGGSAVQNLGITCTEQ